MQNLAMYRSYSGTYCDRNMKSETETYVAHLIFMQLPGITWNNQELKTFLTKMNGTLTPILQQLINTNN